MKQNTDATPGKTKDLVTHSRRCFLRAGGAMVAGSCLGARLGFGSVASKEDSYRFVPGWPKQGCPDVMCRGIDVDAGGTVYVAGDADHPVVRFSEAGKYLGEWKSDVLSGPHGLRVQGDTIWISDVTTHMVHQFSLDGKLIRSFGQKGIAGDAPEQFDRPTDFAFGPDGAVFISDGYGNTRVVCLAPDGHIKKIWGSKGDGPAEFDLVHAIAIDAKNRVVVADRSNQRIQLFSLDGQYLAQWNHVGTPYGLAACDDGSLFVCGLDVDGKRFRVVKLDSDGKPLADFGETGDAPGQFLMAHSILVGSDGAVYVADGKANRVQKFLPGS